MKILSGVVAFCVARAAASDDFTPYSHEYEFQRPRLLTPELHEGFSDSHGIMGLAINGIPFMAEHYEQVDEIAVFRNMEHDFDDCGGHGDSDGHYHYHFAPTCLLKSLGSPFPFSDTWWHGQGNGRHWPQNGHAVEVGLALDGIKIFGPYHPVYQYLLVSPAHAEDSPLDKCHGMKLASGEYAYFLTATAPFLPPCLRHRPGMIRGFAKKLQACQQDATNPAPGCPNHRWFHGSTTDGATNSRRLAANSTCATKATVSGTSSTKCGAACVCPGTSTSKCGSTSAKCGTTGQSWSDRCESTTSVPAGTYQFNVDFSNGPDEVGFLHALMSSIKQQYSAADAAGPKIMLGFSGGSAMSSMMGCYNPTSVYSAHVAVHYNPNADDLPQSCRTTNTACPEFQAQGDRDMFITGLGADDASRAQAYVNQFSALRSNLSCPSEAATETALPAGTGYTSGTCYEFSSCPKLGKMCLYRGFNHATNPDISEQAWTYLTSVTGRSGCSRAGTGSTPSFTSAGNGTWRNELSMMHGNLTRYYSVYVPSGTPTGIMFFLHGTGGQPCAVKNNGGQLRGYEVQRQADKYGFVAVVPLGVPIAMAAGSSGDVAGKATSGGTSTSSSTKCGTSTAKCGTTTAKCGTTTAKCGTTTTKCGTTAAKCGTTAAKCGTTTAKCGTTTAKCGTMSAKCGTSIAKCGTTISGTMVGGTCVCPSSAPTASDVLAGMTCLQVKAAFQANQCCGMPGKPIMAQQLWTSSATTKCGTAAAKCGTAATKCGTMTAKCGTTIAKCGATAAGNTTAKCGTTTAKCGTTIAKCGTTTAKCGTATAKCGTTTAKCGTTTAKCGTTIAKCGTTTAKCGTSTAKCGTTTAKCGTTAATSGITCGDVLAVYKANSCCTMPSSIIGGAKCGTATAKCGTTTAKCGTTTAKCGTTTTKCGTTTAKCGTTAAKCGTTTAKCGTTTAKCGTMSAKCGTTAAKCGTTTTR